jgi:hypothetical protein
MPKDNSDCAAYAGPGRTCRVHVAARRQQPANVRFGPLADIVAHSIDVRFAPESGHPFNRRQRPLCAISVTSHRSKTASLFDHFVGALEQKCRDGEADCLGGLEVEH